MCMTVERPTDMNHEEEKPPDRRVMRYKHHLEAARLKCTR